MATLLGIPKSIALGIVALAPLGAGYASLGPLAGLIALTAGNLSALNRRGASFVNSGPYSVSALMLASAAATFAQVVGPDMAFQLLMLVVFLSGVIQLLLGLLRFGTIAKYIPHPVFSGLMNGSAILILLPQMRPICNASFDQLVADPARLLSTATLIPVGGAALTILVFGFTQHVNRRKHWNLPPAFVAVIIGTLGFHAAMQFGSGSSAGLLVGRMPTGIPLPRLFVNLAASSSSASGLGMPTSDLGFGLDSFDTWRSLAIPIVSFATSIALINSLSSFLAQGYSDSAGRERTDPNAELLNQGTGNLLSAVFGGLPTAGSSSRTKAAYDYGARKPSSRIIGGLFALIVLVGAGPLLAPIPLSVMAGILVILAFSLVDRWLLTQIVLLAKKSAPREVSVSIVISLLVTFVMVVVGMVEAVAVGAILSTVIFVTTMSRGIIRREFTGLSMRSNTERPLRETDILDREGNGIRVIELEGYLYFGTADEFLLRTDVLLREGAHYLIVDLHHLKSVDESGFVVIEHARARCEEAGAHFGLVLPQHSALLHHRQSTHSMYNYLDDALVRAEDEIIDRFRSVRMSEQIRLSDVDILSEFTPAELSLLEPFLSFRTYPHAAKVLSEGEVGDSVFLIAGGRAELYTTTEGLYHCYYRLSQGTIFGEMAMIDGRPRSADVFAAGTLSCWVLTIEHLNRLKQDRPDLAYRLMTGVAALLSRRIRINLNILSQYRK